MHSRYISTTQRPYRASIRINSQIMSSRKIKSQRKQDLRTKNLGVGIGKIDTDENPQPKTNKILFGDDFVASDYESDNEKIKSKKQATASGSEDDSDDEIEQVSALTSKQQAVDMFAAERKTRKEESAVSHKRKRKVKDVPSPPVIPPQESDDEEDDEFDEDFFAAVDEERQKDAKAKKVKKGFAQKKIGRHTTFVSDIDDNHVPTDAGHNIELVVLPGLSSEDGAEDEKRSKDKHAVSLTAGLGTEPSSTALLFCRGSQSLRDENSPGKGIEVKRSRKAKYRLTRGRPSSNFSTKKR